MITKVLQNSELYFTYSNFVFSGVSDLKGSIRNVDV